MMRLSWRRRDESSDSIGRPAFFAQHRCYHSTVELTFIQPTSFASEWRRYGLTDEDLQALEIEIMRRPESGAVMIGTGGLRKMRFAPPSWNRGKSGGLRVCYVVFVEAAQCYLLSMFQKNEMANLSDADKREWRQWIEAKRKELKT
jgi:hypothetical protein